MPWWIRRTLSRGPLRLTLSKGGLGVSVGVGGLRVGSGPRGTYVSAGKGGVYYRQYLRGAPHPGRVQSHPTHSAPAANLDFISDAHASDDSSISALNERRRAMRWSGPLLLISALAVMASLAHMIAPGWAILFLALIIAAFILRIREARQREIVLTYDLDEVMQHAFDALTRGLGEAAASRSIWRIITQEGGADWKRNAGAGTLLSRLPTSFSFAPEKALRTNVMPCSLPVSDGRIYFLPEKMLYLGRSSLSGMRYDDLTASATVSRFREDGPVPSDATLVETTWQYVNRRGGPDKRFKNNRQIPVLLYSALDLAHPDLRLTLQFSRSDAAERVAAAIVAFRAAICATGQSAAQPATPTPPRDGSTTVTMTAATLELLAVRIGEGLAPLRPRLDAAISSPSPAGRARELAPSFTWLREHIATLQGLNAQTVDLCRDRLAKALTSPEPEIPGGYTDDWLNVCTTLCEAFIQWELETRDARLDARLGTIQHLMRGLTRDLMTPLADLPSKLRAATHAVNGVSPPISSHVAFTGMDAITTELAALQTRLVGN